MGKDYSSKTMEAMFICRRLNPKLMRGFRRLCAQTANLDILNLPVSLFKIGSKKAQLSLSKRKCNFRHLSKF